MPAHAYNECFKICAYHLQNVLKQERHMKTLEEARANIDAIDAQMAQLFEARMREVEAVALYKQATGLPIEDKAREASAQTAHAQEVTDPAIRAYYTDMHRNLVEISKAYQRQLLQGMRIAYSGVEGAFANIAARRIFPEEQIVGFLNFQEAYDAVVQGDCDCAVLPIENSYAGEVSQVVDLMFDGPLQVNGVYTLRILQNLLGLPGATVHDVHKVISHPQALAQCMPYIKEHGFVTEDAVNTARAAAAVAAASDKSVAAIASAETSDLYGLEVIERAINKSLLNTTRFAVFSRCENTSRARTNSTFMMLFAVNNETGALANAINVIARHGFNMTSLRSHPLKNKPWQYYFYVEAEGDESSEEGKRMISELQEHCSQIKVVGHYNAEVALEEA